MLGGTLNIRDNVTTSYKEVYNIVLDGTLNIRGNLTLSYKGVYNIVLGGCFIIVLGLVQ